MFEVDAMFEGSVSSASGGVGKVAPFVGEERAGDVRSIIDGDAGSVSITELSKFVGNGEVYSS